MLNGSLNTDHNIKTDNNATSKIHVFIYILTELCGKPDKIKNMQRYQRHDTDTSKEMYEIMGTGKIAR